VQVSVPATRPRAYNGRVLVLENPLLRELLTRLRDRNTGRREFRELLRLVGIYMGYELAHLLPCRRVVVETPLGVRAEGVEIEDERITVLAVLRAAIPMAQGLLEVLKDAKLGVIAAKRVEMEDAASHNFEFEIRISYVNVPPNDVLVVVDPMFASGMTMLRCLEIAYDLHEFEKTFVLTVISTDLAIRRILDAFPDVKILTLAIDPELNRRGYIVPGLGDAGDRAFG